MKIRNGADTVSSHLIELGAGPHEVEVHQPEHDEAEELGYAVPHEARAAAERRSIAGHIAASSALMASPPTQVWMPNQPHATSERRSAGT